MIENLSALSDNQVEMIVVTLIVFISIMGFLSIIYIFNWRSVRIRESELAFQMELIDRGYTIAEVRDLVMVGKDKRYRKNEMKRKMQQEQFVAAPPLGNEPQPEQQSNNQTIANQSTDPGSFMTDRLFRPTERSFLGVCAAMGNYFQIDATLMRIFFIGGLIFSGFVPLIILYFVMAAVIPDEDSLREELRRTDEYQAQKAQATA